MQVQIRCGGDISEASLISSGIQKRCILGPLLFKLFFTAVLNHNTMDLNKGINIRYRNDGSIYDSGSEQRPKHKNFLSSLLCPTHRLRGISPVFGRQFWWSLQEFRSYHQLGKTVVLSKPSPLSSPVIPSIHLSGSELQNVNHCTYLGSTISKDGSLNQIITSRIQKASQSLGRLRNRILNQHTITLSSKMNI